MSGDIPPQEQNRKWFRSFLRNRELELQELYDLPQGELDLVMAENPDHPQPLTPTTKPCWRGVGLGMTLHIERKVDRQQIR